MEFDFYFSPYSILYWDKIGRMGETDAVFAALELACETLLPYENFTDCCLTGISSSTWTTTVTTFTTPTRRARWRWKRSIPVPIG